MDRRADDDVPPVERPRAIGVEQRAVLVVPEELLLPETHEPTRLNTLALTAAGTIPSAKYA